MFSSPVKSRYLVPIKKLEIDKKFTIDFLSFFKLFAVVSKNNYLKNLKKKLYYFYLTESQTFLYYYISIHYKNSFI